MIEIKDFTPGIVDTYHGSNTLLFASNGAATIESTYACIADVNGSLGPLPKVIDFDEITLQSSLPYTSAAGKEGMYAIDAVYLYEQIWIFYNLLGDFATGTSYRLYHWGRRFLVQADGTIGSPNDFWWSQSQLSIPETEIAPNRTAPSISVGKSAKNGGASPPGLQDVYSHLIFSLPNLSPASGAIPAAELGFITYDSDYTTNYPSPAIGTFVAPSPASITTISRFKITNTDSTTKVLGHRNRVMSVQSFNSALYDSAYDISPILYTPAGDNDGTAKFLHLSDENDSTVSILTTTTGEELLAIRKSGGGVVVRGDIDNPTIYRYPFLESTYGKTTTPAQTPLGLVYCTAHGVFLWEGTQLSRKLSEQFDGAFWATDGMIQHDYYRGKCAWWHPYVLVPNNYLVDSRTGAWWRLVNPATNGQFNVYVVTDDGVMVAFTEHVRKTATSTTDKYILQTFLPGELSSTYSWKSHPVIESINRQMRFKDITIVASLHPSSAESAHVVVTLYGFDDQGNALEEKEVRINLRGTGSNNGPQIVTEIIPDGWVAQHVQIRLQANSGNTSAPAPRIHSVKVDTFERQSRTRNG